MRLFAAINAGLLSQRGHLFPWAPVCLGGGIGLYFGLRFEPEQDLYLTVAALGAVLAVAAWRWPERWGAGWMAPGWAVMLIAAGFCLAGARAHQVADPVLTWRYYGPIEGRVVALDRSSSDALRMTLDQVRLERTAPGRTPGRVRVSLHGAGALPQAGARVMTTGHLMPPQGPAEPGGFDFRRHAWFQGIGAVGYTRVEVLRSAPAQAGSFWTHVFALRMAASARIQKALPGEIGGFASAITTGDRSAVGHAALQALRDSNLAHLLAISGLHMGLLAGFVFGAARIGLTLVPVLALRLPVKQIAAVAALVAATGYLLLSGGNVATERAFVMVAVALGAVMLERRAFSLRAVAFAALIVLIRRPEALLSPGFQMSFAATTALVAVFGWIRDGQIPMGPRWLRPVVAVVISSAVAGAATAPFGAAHFNALAHYGLLANLVSVPLMGLVVIPSAVVALCLFPLGLDWIGLWVMGLGLRWILGVAGWVSGLEGARGYVVSPDGAVLPLITLGGLVVILWRGRLRWSGLVPVCAALFMWAGAERPAVLVADTGGLIGVMTPQGRALSKEKGSGFVAGIWLENDGDPAVQLQAAALWPNGGKGRKSWQLGEDEIVHLIGKRAVGAFDGCTARQIVIASAPVADDAGPCRVFDIDRLRRTGALAVTPKGIVTARQISGARLWTGP
jgi:competence protein ComEC